MNLNSQITKALKILMFSFIGIAFVLGIVLGAFVIAPGRVQKNTHYTAGASKTPSPKSTVSAADIRPDGDFKLPQPGEGESLYFGSADFDGASKFQMAFVLSEGGNEIHNVMIFIKDINKKTAQIQISGVTITETYSASYPLVSGGTDIRLGSSTLYGLAITGDSASGNIEYVYTNYNGAKATEIPFGEKDIVFKKITGSSSGSSPAATETTAAKAAVAEITFEDTVYSVTLGKIGIGESGNITIAVESPGIGETLPMRDGKWAIPVQAMIVVGGETIGWDTVTTTTNSLVFEYATKEMPEQIILYPYGGQEDGSTHVVFDAQTKTIIP